MGRPLRIEFPGAFSRLINRGNYRQGLFGAEGAAKAFVHAPREAAERLGWWAHVWARRE